MAKEKKKEKSSAWIMLSLFQTIPESVEPWLPQDFSNGRFSDAIWSRPCTYKSHFDKSPNSEMYHFRYSKHITSIGSSERQPIFIEIPK